MGIGLIREWGKSYVTLIEIIEPNLVFLFLIIVQETNLRPSLAILRRKSYTVVDFTFSFVILKKKLVRFEMTVQLEDINLYKKQYFFQSSVRSFCF